jgi:peroxiredoxin
MKFTTLKIFISAISFLTFVTGCSLITTPEVENAGLISGTFIGIDEGTPIMLRSFKNGSLIKVAQCESGVGGTFSLTPEKPLRQGYHQLIINKRWPIVLITDSTEAPIVSGTVPDDKGYITNSTITGSASSELLASYYKVLMPKQDSLLMIQNSIKNLNNEDKTVATQTLNRLIIELDNLSLEFIKSNPESPSTLAALENLSPEKYAVAYKSVLKTLSKTYADSHYFTMLKTKYEKSISQRKIPNQPPPKKKTSGKNSTYSVGDEAPDITMNNTDGETIRLSDLRGDVVLIDFWASWCGPCRRENPNLVRAYEKFHSKGFEVFSVSLDSNKDKWINAIKKDGLVWDNHVSDLQGWRNEASRAYGISSIPHAILVGKDGVIIRTHIRGAALETELEKLFD